jgi:hypothetical protein
MTAINTHDDKLQNESEGNNRWQSFLKNLQTIRNMKCRSFENNTTPTQNKFEK